MFCSCPRDLHRLRGHFLLQKFIYDEYMRFILDLDDTLAQTTRDMQGDVARVSSLTLAPGVGEFIELLNSRGDFYALVTVGDEALQAEQSTHLRLMIPQVVIVPKTDDPYMKSEAVAQIVDARREGEA